MTMDLLVEGDSHVILLLNYIELIALYCYLFIVYHLAQNTR